MLQYVAVSCSVLQCVAVSCIVTHLWTPRVPWVCTCMRVHTRARTRYGLVRSRRGAAAAVCVWGCCSVLPRVAMCCSVLQCVAVCCSVLQCVACLVSVAVCCSMLQCIAVCCGVLQCVAVCCSVLQRVAARCSVLNCSFQDSLPTHVLQCVCCSMLQCVAVCCSQSVAVCCSALQCVVSLFLGLSPHRSVKLSPGCVLQHIAGCCGATHSMPFLCSVRRSVLQRVAVYSVYCSVLQRVLQRVVVCCSVL